MTSPEPQSADALRAEFTALYGGCAEWLYGYLLSLLRRPDDAEEVLQQTAEVLWQKFDQYHRGTEFRAWACRIAHFKALKYRKKSAHLPQAFSELFLDLVDEEAVVMADRLDARIAALDDCLKKLPPRDLQLIQQRYAPQGSVTDVASRLRCSTHSVYRSLARIHDALFHCISRAVAQEGTP